jgi:hypothetical protein
VEGGLAIVWVRHLEREEMQQKHSGLGIVSFISSLISGALLFVIIAIAGVMEVSNPDGVDEESPVVIFLGLCMFAFLFAALVAMVLGIGALFQRDRNKIFAVLGAVFSACAFFGTLLLILIGLVIE